MKQHTSHAKDIIKHGVSGFVFKNDNELPSLLFKHLRDYDKLKNIQKNLTELKHDLHSDNINKKYKKIMGIEVV